MKRWFTWIAAFASAAVLTACWDDDDEPTTPPAPTQNIVQVAQANNFNALLAAATKAGLATTLSDANASLTVFAPTDAAFGTLATRLGFASADAMVQALPAQALASILTYHVLPTRKAAADLVAGGATQDTAYTFGGAPARLSLSTTSGVVLTDAVLTTARVTQADVGATNGVVHVIDKVLVPPGVLNVVQMAQANPAFSSLVSAVVQANLQGTLSGAGPFTVFAPTDTAFAAAPSGLTVPQLTTVLTYHVLGAQVLSSQIPFGQPVATLANQSITIEQGTPPRIRDTTANRASIAAVDVRASNGVIHVIDKVLIPAL